MPDRRRDLRTTLLCLQRLIPESETSLHAGIRSILTSIPYTPPECEGELWGRLVYQLEADVGEPKTQWQIAVADVVSDRPVTWSETGSPDVFKAALRDLCRPITNRKPGGKDMFDVYEEMLNAMQKHSSVIALVLKEESSVVR